MNSLVELLDCVQSLPASSAILAVCLVALAVVWKALDVVAGYQRKRPPKKRL